MFITTRQAADVLGMSPNSVKKLIATGALLGVQYRGVRATLPLSDVETLAARPWLRPSDFGLAELPVLRVGAAESVSELHLTPARSWAGFGVRLSPAELLKALQCWWRGDPAGISAATFLPVTVSRFVVAVLSEVKPAATRSTVSAAGRTEVRHSFDCQLSGYVTDLVAPHFMVSPGQSAEGEARTRLLLGNRVESLSGGPIAYVKQSDEILMGKWA